MNLAVCAIFKNEAPYLAEWHMSQHIQTGSKKIVVNVWSDAARQAAAETRRMRAVADLRRGDRIEHPEDAQGGSNLVVVQKIIHGGPLSGIDVHTDKGKFNFSLDDSVRTVEETMEKPRRRNLTRHLKRQQWKRK